MDQQHTIPCGKTGVSPTDLPQRFRPEQSAVAGTILKTVGERPGHAKIALFCLQGHLAIDHSIVIFSRKGSIGVILSEHL
jgi:hypothetical protein